MGTKDGTDERQECLTSDALPTELLRKFLELAPEDGFEPPTFRLK
jgi:hypothetical protein